MEVCRARIGTENESCHDWQKSRYINRRNIFSSRALESLTAICDTLVPSLRYEMTSLNPDSSLQRESLAESCQDEVEAFYELSASQSDVPEHMIELMCLNFKPLILWAVSSILWMLSTGIGTFILFGMGALSGSFPYVQKFARVPLSQREQLLVSWSHSRRKIFRTLFRIFKGICCFSLYTKVDENNHNPTWSAIGYCGPDPVAVASRKELGGKRGLTKPLEGQVIDANSTTDNLQFILENYGFTEVDIRQFANIGNLSVRGRRTFGIKCDVVIVGSGSGGGVCAGVLAQAGLKVVVLEKGKYLARDDLTLLEGFSMESMYEGGGLFSTVDGGITVQAGSTVGGGSTVNWSASFQTPPYVLKEWGNVHKLSTFIRPEYQKAMDVVLNKLGVQANVEKENFANTVLRRGCQEIGYRVDHVPTNCSNDHFCGWCGFGCWNGRKQATSETWLVEATAAGAVILTGCTAMAVLHKGNMKNRQKCRKAVGVVASFGQGSDYLFVEAGVTIVACGSVQSPGLLLRSGLKNARIGKNLHLHISQCLWGYFPEGQGPPGKSYEGTILSSICKLETTNFNAIPYGTILETPSMHPGGFAASMPWLSGCDHKNRMRRYARTAHIFVLIKDKGSGVVDCNGDIRYDLDPTDEQKLKEGGEKALRALIAAGAVEVGTHHIDGDRLRVNAASATEIEDFLHRVQSKELKNLSVPLFSAHQMGTCRMGVDPKTSVVDERGETWEVEGLFVADASVFPTSLGVNPMVTVQSIAYCIAGFVLDYWQIENNSGHNKSNVDKRSQVKPAPEAHKAEHVDDFQPYGERETRERERQRE
eukprot:c14587_g2_i1 orf=2-2455(-)